jgi:hypothetical protein
MKRSVDRAAGASSSKDREPHERLGGRRYAAEPSNRIRTASRPHPECVNCPETGRTSAAEPPAHRLLPGGLYRMIYGSRQLLLFCVALTIA